MSRFRIKLIPQGAIPQDLNIGIQLTPLVEPGAAPGDCCPTCGSWGVTINGTTATGFPYLIPNGAFEVLVEHVDGDVCGGCIDWELRPIRIDSLYPAVFGLVSIPTGTELCDSVLIVGADPAPDSYAGLIFSLWASINGAPFCEALIFTFGGSGCEPTLTVDGWYSLLDSPFSPPPDPPQTPIEPGLGGEVLNETTFPNRAFTLDFSPDIYGDWIEKCGYLPTATLSFLGGNPGAYADFSIVNTDTANAVFRLVATGVNDYTNIQVALQVELLAWPGTPTTPAPALITPIIFLDCTGVP